MSFPKRTNEDGTTNSKYVDLLDEDKPISGQKFACVSFVSPENILKQKDMFYFQNFLKHFDFEKSSNKFVQFLNFLSYKFSLNFETVINEYNTLRNHLNSPLIRLNIYNDNMPYLQYQPSNGGPWQHI